MALSPTKLFTDRFKVGVDPVQSTTAHYSSHGSGLNIGVEGSSDKGTGVLGLGGAEGIIGIGDNVGVSGFSMTGNGVVGDSHSPKDDAVKGTNYNQEPGSPGCGVFTGGRQGGKHWVRRRVRN